MSPSDKFFGTMIVGNSSKACNCECISINFISISGQYSQCVWRDDSPASYQFLDELNSITHSVGP
jgi:hypothetical protein